jgi:hypothetical protein
MAFAGGFMKPPSRPPRTPSRLSDFLHHQLNSYVLAASAAGVSLLALTPPAEAKVVYTKTHQDIGTNGIYELDLNHDGIVDFLLQQFGTSSLNSNRLLADEALGNAVLGSLNRSNSRKSIRHYAAALKPGARIGPRQHFVKGGNNGETMAWIWVDPDIGQYHTYGKWIDLNNRYLGLKFKINGSIHYGWARLSVHNAGTKITATLTGYAYETVPNRSIQAGQTSGGSATEPTNPEAEPGTTLGALSLGAQTVLSRKQP